MTGGLVQDITHTVLPNISPLATAVLTLMSMVPALVKLWLSPNSLTKFLRYLVLCAWSSFYLAGMFMRRFCSLSSFPWLSWHWALGRRQSMYWLINISLTDSS